MKRTSLLRGALGACLFAVGCAADPPPPGPLLPDEPRSVATDEGLHAEALLFGLTTDGRLSDTAITRARACIAGLHALGADSTVGRHPLRSPSVNLWLTPAAEAHIRAGYDAEARRALAARGRVGLPEVDATLEALGAQSVASLDVSSQSESALRIELPWSVEPYGASWRLLRLAAVRDASPGGLSAPSDRLWLRVDDDGAWHLITEEGSGDCTSGCRGAEVHAYTCDPSGAIVADEPNGAHATASNPSLQPYPDLDALLEAARSGSHPRALRVLHAVSVSATPTSSVDLPIADRWASVHEAAVARAPEVAATLVSVLRAGERDTARTAWTYLVDWRGDFVDPDAADWESWATSPPPIPSLLESPFRHLRRGVVHQ